MSGGGGRAVSENGFVRDLFPPAIQPLNAVSVQVAQSQVQIALDNLRNNLVTCRSAAEHALYQVRIVNPTAQPQYSQVRLGHEVKAAALAYGTTCGAIFQGQTTAQAINEVLKGFIDGKILESLGMSQVLQSVQGLLDALARPAAPPQGEPSHDLSSECAPSVVGCKRKRSSVLKELCAELGRVSESGLKEAARLGDLEAATRCFRPDLPVDTPGQEADVPDASPVRVANKPNRQKLTRIRRDFSTPVVKTMLKTLAAIYGLPCDAEGLNKALQWSIGERLKFQMDEEETCPKDKHHPLQDPSCDEPSTLLDRTGCVVSSSALLASPNNVQPVQESL